MQDRNARIETVDREAKTGDTVILDFEGFVDGRPFDGGKAEGYPDARLRRVHPRL